ncbi:MAG: inositol monophosphatase [Planctomycetales bacterium]|nr:inositol monophosphatase [Planctomycetales bacterium]
MSIPHTKLSQMLETTVAAARLAGQRAMEELRCTRKSIKNGNEMVTQADPICQKLIIDRIRENYPDHGFLAEEGPAGKLFRIQPRSDEPIWWVIDPIDGTNNFANGLLCFCVSIAAMFDGKPILGVIFDPTTDSMFTGALDMDAQLNGSTITVNQDDIGEFVSFGIDNHASPQTDTGIRKIMTQTRFRALGTTALHMAYVAKGAMVGMATNAAKLWDIAAGAIIIERAGGLVTDLEGKNHFPVKPELYNAQLCITIGTNRKTHRQTLEYFAQK